MKAALAVLLALVAGCVPAPLLRLTSRDADAHWLQGRQQVRRVSDGVTVHASFDRSSDRHIGFVVEVANRSDSTILLEPERFHFTLAHPGGDAPPALRGPFQALDPEARLERLDREAAAERARHGTAATLDAVTGVADAVLDTWQARTRTAEEEERDALHDLERAVERLEEADTHERTLFRLARARAAWTDRALRRTHLLPGREARGWIVLPAGPVHALLAGPARPYSITGTEPPAIAECTLTLHAPVGDRIHAMSWAVRKLPR